MSSDEVMNYEKNGGYNPYEIYNNDADIRSGGVKKWDLLEKMN